MKQSTFRRVIYEKNPLEGVTCECRFPAVLKIQTELPAEFQETVRVLLPKFQEIAQTVLDLRLPPEATAQLGAFAPATTKKFAFTSLDGVWTLALARDLMALTCTRYKRWEELMEFWVPAVAALEKIYSPACYVRVGLRYQNVIWRTRLGFENVPWSMLLEPHIAAALASPEHEGRVLEALHSVTLRLGDGQDRVVVRHGLVRPENDEERYVIDNDFSIEGEIPVGTLPSKLRFFHEQSGRHFHSCISERLHAAMGPVGVD